MFDIAITPNRGDCLGVRGIARDLAAAGAGTLRPLVVPDTSVRDVAPGAASGGTSLDEIPRSGHFSSPIRWQRDGEVGHDCPYVAGCYVRGVTNGPSPVWMQQRLRAIGLRPISALVDITNYVTFDIGRPLHVYDADKLAGDLSMRHARKNETVQALDGKCYKMREDMVVIADF